MTRKLMEEERERLAMEYGKSLPEEYNDSGDQMSAQLDFIKGFNAALALMEKHRVKPSREALCEAIGYISDPGGYWNNSEA